MDPVRSRGTGFSFQYRTPEISQSEGLVVDFSIVRGEVDSGPLILSLDGLESGTVMGRGGVICEGRCMLVSNMLGVSDGSTVLPI